MCLTEKVLRIYFEQNQLCIQVWRFTIGKFNRDVLVSNISRTTPIAQAAKTAAKGHQIRQQH